jgi:small-conductance mechanosensitive channel
MLIQTWGEVFTASLQGLWIGFIQFVPMLLLAIIIFIVGWVVASVVGKAFSQVIGALKLDKLLSSAGADHMFERAGIKLDVGGFIGWLVKWFIILAFLVASLNLIGLNVINEFIRDVILAYIPQVSSARAAHVPSAGMLGTIAYYAIWIFGFIIALSHLGIAEGYMQSLFIAIVAMLALAGGLAFGLGGRDAAARAIDHFRSDLK